MGSERKQVIVDTRIIEAITKFKEDYPRISYLVAIRDNLLPSFIFDYLDQETVGYVWFGEADIIPRLPVRNKDDFKEAIIFEVEDFDMELIPEPIGDEHYNLEKNHIYFYCLITNTHVYLVKGESDKYKLVADWIQGT